MSIDFAACVKKAQHGDADAFAELYSLVYKDLYRIALLSLNNQHDASDVVSDTVLEAYTSLKDLRNENAFRSWIMKILSAKIKRKQKEYAQVRNYQTELDDMDGNGQQGQSEINYEGIEVMDGFRQLGEEDRLILSLDVVSGYKSEEIAEIVGGNANTIRSKAARAREKLKRILTGK